MPKRTDIRKILLIGSGPIVIGQACEFDYSGTQACKALREEGFEVVLVNSNPATIMTDPELADRTYVEPLTPEVARARSSRASGPTRSSRRSAGRPALNLAVALAERGVLDRYGVELIGAKLEAIKKAEDRELFKAAMQRIGLDAARARATRGRSSEAREVVAATIGLPRDHPPVASRWAAPAAAIAYNPRRVRRASIRWGSSRARSARCWSRSR